MIGLALVVTTLLLSAPDQLPGCEGLATLPLDGGTVTGSEAIGPGEWKAPDGKLLTDLPATCRVTLRLQPGAGSSIQAEVWLPRERWNWRLLGTGNGSYGGVIFHDDLADGVASGFATVNDDMGTAPAKGLDGSPLVGQPVKWLDFGWRATHATAIAARQVVEAFYGKPPHHAYFVGCSSGGRQALMEAQRFPEDYDGIVAGCAAREFTRTISQVVWMHRALRASAEASPSPEGLQALRKAVLASCGPTDSGPAGEPWLVDPARCAFDPDAIRCGATSGGTDCLTAAQVDAVRKIYAGPRNPRTGAQIYPGLPRGAEPVRYWAFLAGQPQPPWDGIFRWVFGPTWDAATFDFDRDEATLEAVLGPLLDASSPDLSRFARRGGKLLLWHGWSDPLNPAGASVDYYRQLAAAQPGGLVSLRRFARLFLVPGVDHCAGGPGADGFWAARPASAPDPEHDMLMALVRWVEQGVAPSRIVASKFLDDQPRKGVAFQRPLCPYPEVARYRGTGDRTQASSFSCRAPR